MMDDFNNKKVKKNTPCVVNKIIKKEIIKNNAIACGNKIITKKKLKKNSMEYVGKNNVKKNPPAEQCKINNLTIDKKNQSTTIAVDKTPVKKPNAALLLAYTYFIRNNNHDEDVKDAERKHIIVGLDVDEFTPHVIIQTSDEKHMIKFKLLEWLSLTVQDEKIKEFFDQNPDGDKKISLSSLKLQPTPHISIDLSLKKKKKMWVLFLEKKKITLNKT